MRLSVLNVSLVILCVALLVGGSLTYLHKGAHYEVDFEQTPEGFQYSVYSDASAEFDIVLMDVSASVPLEKLYLYFDPDYGSVMSNLEKYIKTIMEKLKDRGFKEVELINAQKLSDVISGPSFGVGILIGAGAIPDNVIDEKLLNWVKSGGTLYWTYDKIGLYSAHSDGTYSMLENSKESDFLGAECTVYGGNSKIIDESNDFSKMLGFENTILYGALDTSLIPGPYSSMGHCDGSISEVTFVKCGDGAVCVISGWDHPYAISDIAQVISSKVTLESKTIYSAHEKSCKEKVVIQENIPLIASHKYVLYAYVCGLNYSYGQSIVLLAK